MVDCGYVEVHEPTRMATPTLRDIAEQLGVSTATVSLAMRGHKRISENTRNRVNAALEESGYVYRRGAASLRTSTTHTVGVILNNVSDPFFSALLASLEDALARTGRTVFLCNTDESLERQDNFIQKMSEYNADGIVVSPAIGSMLTHFTPKRFPVPPLVFVSRSLLDSEFDHVINDDYQAARCATERLVSLGHRRIAVVGGHPSITCFGERLRGHRAALERASIAFDESLVKSLVPNRLEGFRAARWVCELEPRPTAAICYNDSVALGLFQGLAREGVLPGRNFALIGNEDIEEANLVHPRMSATRVSRDEMGRQAAAILVERIENPDAPPKRIVLETRLVVRETCGVAPPPMP